MLLWQTLTITSTCARGRESLPLKKPNVNADTSGTEDNQAEPANRLTELVEYMFNIGHEVSKRCSSQGEANRPLVHNNLPF